jgi:hypothetical protein
MELSATNPRSQELIGSHELREITELLVKHHGLHEGIFDLAIEFQIAVGGMGMDSSSILPGAMINVKRIGLTKAPKAGTATVDAAEVNPRVETIPKAANKAVAKKVVSK